MGLVLEIPTPNEWHVLKSETKLIHMMQNNLVFGFDYIWSPHLESWTALSDLPEFSTDRLSALAQKNTVSKVFNRREHQRTTCELSVFVNDQQTFWEGTVENLSEGGALVLMKNPVLLPGHIIHLHFRSRSEKDTAFNCTAQVLTKRLVKQRIKFDTGIHYAVKFLTQTATGEVAIEKFMKEFKK
jgi:hypothetical protein